MIENSTVFILGAGASTPYGYPTGDELIKDILKGLTSDPKKSRLINAGFELSEIKKFRDDLRGSKTFTIDAFLEYRQDMAEIGKFCIADSLIGYEDKHSLLNPEKDEDWYRLLYRGLKAPFKQLQIIK